MTVIIFSAVYSFVQQNIYCHILWKCFCFSKYFFSSVTEPSPKSFKCSRERITWAQEIISCLLYWAAALFCLKAVFTRLLFENNCILLHIKYVRVAAVVSEILGEKNPLKTMTLVGICEENHTSLTCIIWQVVGMATRVRCTYTCVRFGNSWNLTRMKSAICNRRESVSDFLSAKIKKLPRFFVIYFYYSVSVRMRDTVFQFRHLLYVCLTLKM